MELCSGWKTESEGLENLYVLGIFVSRLSQLICYM